MSTTYSWAIIFALMIMVLLMRWSFLFLPRRFQPKGALAQALSFAPLAALIAICVPEIMKFQIGSFTNPSSNWLGVLLTDWRLWGGLVMLIVASVFRQSKSASLYGLVGAAIVVFVI